MKKPFPEAKLKSNLLKGIMLVAAISVCLLAAYDVLFIFPSFNQLFMKAYERQSLKVARHVENVLLSKNILPGKTAFPGSFKKETGLIKNDFELWKILVISPTGKIVYSTDKADIGRKLNEKFFFEVVAKGGVYSKYVPKNTLTPGGQVAGNDVISTYMPVMQNGRFLGACEVYSNVSAVMKEIRRLFVASFLVLFLLLTGLFLALITIWRKAKQSAAARKKAEDVLAESENLLRTIIETVPECVKLLSADGKVLMMNRAGLMMLGSVSFEQMKGEKLTPFILPEYREAFGNLNRQVFEGKPGMLEFEAQGMDNKRLWLSTHAVPLPGKDGKTVALLGITRDITKEKHAAEALTTSLKEKEVLLRELYHRTKNNLQVVISLISLQAANVTDEHLKQALEDISLRIRAMSLVHEKLYKSKDLTSVDVKDYVEDLANAILIGYEKSAASISLKLDIDKTLMTIDAITTLGLIINELMTNSIKYAFPAGREGRIGISLHSLGDHLEFVFSDNGVGLADTDIKKAKSLGLKLVDKLSVKQLGGRLEVKTDNGTEFRITFKA
ncbi:MAG: PAS domain S-box protein [Actinomycetota bacterium]|nr:PAS domain S-box protein [Actinomycetota bacterium]